MGHRPRGHVDRQRQVVSRRLQTKRIRPTVARTPPPLPLLARDGAGLALQVRNAAIDQPLTRAHYQAIAAFRYRLRLFLQFSEAAAAAVGLPAQQHQALLVIAGYPEGEAPTIGSVAQRLVVEPQTATELVGRMVAAGLVTKRQGRSDGRRQELALTSKAAAMLDKLTTVHLRELRELRQVLAAAAPADGAPGEGG